MPSERTYKLNAGEVHKLREHLGLSIELLAKKTGVHIRTLRKWLDGKPAFIGNIKSLANALNTGTQNISDTINEKRVPLFNQIAAYEIPLSVSLERTNVNWLVNPYDKFVVLFSEFFARPIIPDGTLCRHPDDVQEAVELLVTSSGRNSSDDKQVTLEKASRLLDVTTKISFMEYLSKVIATWRLSPWTIAFAVSDGLRVGCTRILPMSEDAYDEIRAGRLNIDHCVENHFHVPSRSFYVDGIGWKSEDEYPFLSNKTKRHVIAIFLQMAHLSRGTKNGIRMLSMGGSPMARILLGHWGFRPLAVKMHGIDMTLFELVDERKIFIDMIISEIHNHLI